VVVLAPGAAGAETPGWKRRLYFRGIGVARVTTFEDSREMKLAGVDGPASLAVRNGPIAGSGASVSFPTILAASIGYRLPEVHERLSLELVVGSAPSLSLFPTAKFRATGTLEKESIAPEALGIPTGVPPLGAELGQTQALPVILTFPVQLARSGLLRPYVGAGLAIMFTRKEEITNPILMEVREPDFSILPAPGVVAQAGLDVKLWKGVYARLDVKFIGLMLARAEVQHIYVRTPDLPLFESAEVATAKMSMWVNPLIVQGGVGFDFFGY